MAAAVIGVFSLMPDPPEIESPFGSFDKLEHFLGYFVLAFLSYMSFKRSRGALLLSILACTVFGGLIELLQYFTLRDADLVDMAVNFVASSAGALSCFVICRRSIRKS